MEEAAEMNCRRRRHDLAEAEGIIHGALMGLAIWLLVILLLVLLAGCSRTTPYVAGRHISDPLVQGDGWDLACAGIKKHGQLELKGGYCWNLRGGSMVELSVEWEVFRDESHD